MDQLLNEFREFQKIPRLSRDMIITEKIDGTNAQIFITEYGDIFTGSRHRWITPQNDNAGFAKWVQGNRGEILKLGSGRHFGEWWGNGINRGYGLPKGEHRLSLFNLARWVFREDKAKLPECVSVVPILYQGMFDTAMVDTILNELKEHGSYAAPGYMNPEGVVVYHTAGNTMFKKTIGNDGIPKSLLNKEIL